MDSLISFFDELEKIAQSIENKSTPSAPASNIIPTIGKETEDVWSLAVQRYKGERGGDQFNLRLSDPDRGQSYSWALPKSKLPTFGEKVRITQSSDQVPGRMSFFEGGVTEKMKGRQGVGTVRVIRKEPTDIIEADKNKIRFNTYDGRDSNEFLLRKTKGDSWTLQNVTMTKDKHPEIPQSKPDYKEIKPGNVDVSDNSQLMMAKVDGAHNTFVLNGGKPLRVFSYRPSGRASGLIEHTHKFLPGMKVEVPKELDGYVVRGELFTSDPKSGKSREATETATALNSDVWKSRAIQTKTPLRAVIFDVARKDGKSVEEIPYKEKLPILRQVNKALPFLELPPMADTAEKKIDLLNRIRSKQEPITTEGVVLWPMEGGAPIKAKFRPDYDVYVRKIYPEAGKREGLAGGFYYSWTPKGKVVGRVGAGMNHGLKKDMIDNQKDYIGRVARVAAQGTYTYQDPNKKPSLRDPIFKDWHLDKGLQPIK